MDTGKIILGVVGGLAVGAVLGVLFAPSKGSATRKKIASKGGDISHEFDEKFHDMIKVFKKQFEIIKSEVVHHTGNGKINEDKVAAEVVSDVKR